MGCGRIVRQIGLALAMGLAACGGQAPAVRTGPTEVQTGSAGGPRVVAIGRPVHEALMLSLFVDAGSRDSTKAATAALTATLMAQAAGAEAFGVAYPDGMEVSIPCRSESLDECVGKLSRALALRTVAPPHLETARAELTAAVAARKAEDDTHALTLAIENATSKGFGAGLSWEADSRALSAVSATDVEEFLRAHAGPKRALLVASGAVRPARLKKAVEAHFSDLPRAAQARSDRPPFPAAASYEDGLIAEGPRHVLGLAFRGARLSQVEAACRLTARAARREAQQPTLSECTAMPLRGAAIALLSASAPAAGPLLRLAAQAQSNLDLDQDSSATEAPPNLLADNRGEGLAFVAGAEQPGGSRRLGIGLLTPRTASMLRPGLDQVRSAGARPALDAAGDDHEAQTQVDSPAGVAHIHVRARQTARATLVIGRSPGSSEDPGNMHGRAALLATLAATHCDGLEASALRAQLAQLDAELSPLVNTRRWGLMLTLPAEHLSAGQDLLLRCVLHPSLTRAHVAQARLALRSRLQARGPEHPRHRDILAHRLLPRAPGEVAPLGTTDEVARIGLEALQRALSTRRELTLAIVAPGEATGRVRHAAQALAIRSLGDSPLPAARTDEELPRTGGPAGAEPTPGSLASPEPTLIVLRSQGVEAGGEAGAQAAALALQAALTQVLEIPASDAAGGALPGGGYAAVVIQLTEPLPDDFQSRLRSALTALGVPEALVTRLHEENAWRWDTATESTAGEALVLAGFARPGPRSSLQASLSLAKQLLNSVPQVWLVSP